MNKLWGFFLLLIFTFNSLGCGSLSIVREKSLNKALTDFEQLQEPPLLPQRTAELPLVAAIPGLNLPGAPTGHNQFGQLAQLMQKEGYPFFFVAYDEKIYPVNDVAGLYYGKHSISMTRVLPTLSSAIEKENEIRSEQGVTPLKELVLISYSQGGVLAADVVRAMLQFKIYWDDFVAETGIEWKILKNDPEFLFFKENLENAIVFTNIKRQNEKQLNLNYDFRRFDKKIEKELEQSKERFRTYLTNPKELFPNRNFASGRNKGYPRKYSKVLKWLEKPFIGPAMRGDYGFLFWKNYVEYEQFLDLQLRFFSMAGSYFGSPTANKTYDILKILPRRLDDALIGPVENQIRDTQLGTRNHLNMIKDFLKLTKPENQKYRRENVLFLVGANGNKGDGLVGQSSAHFSSHAYSEIQLKELLSSNSENTIQLKEERMPRYPVTGIKAHHLPKTTLFFFKEPGIAQISTKSTAYQFLIPFLEKDFSKLEKLHSAHNKDLREFMVIVDLPLDDALKNYRINLKPQSKHIKLTGRFYNGSAHSYVWTGYSTQKEGFLNIDTIDLDETAELILSLSNGTTINSEIDVNIHPGTNHIIQVTSN